MDFRNDETLNILGISLADFYCDAHIVIPGNVAAKNG